MSRLFEQAGSMSFRGRPQAAAWRASSASTSGRMSTVIVMGTLHSFTVPPPFVPVNKSAPSVYAALFALLLLHLRHDLPRRHDSGASECRREVLDVAGHEVVGTGRRCAFEEPVVGLIRGLFERLGWCYKHSLEPCQVEEPTHPFRIEAQLGTKQHAFILGEDGLRDAEVHTVGCHQI